MNAEESEIYAFLQQYRTVYVSVIEISKCVGHRRNFLTDRAWARPILRRMEMDGILESNPSGEYRIKRGGEDTTTFLRALERSDISLGDTTIISLDDVKKKKKQNFEDDSRSSVLG